MSDSSQQDDIETTLEGFLISHDGPVLIFNPNLRIINSVVNSLAAVEDGWIPKVEIVAHRSTLETLRQNMLPAAKAVEVIEEGNLTLSCTDETTGNIETVTPNFRGIIGVENGEIIQTGDGSGWDSAKETAKSADRFDLRTLPLDSIISQVSDLVGEQAANDFIDVEDQLERVRGDEGGDALKSLIISATKNNASVEGVRSCASEIPEWSLDSIEVKLSELKDLGLITVDDDDDVLSFTDNRLAKKSPNGIASVVAPLS